MIGKSNSNKKAKLKERAQNEIDILDKCLAERNKIVLEFKAQIEEINAKIGVLVEHGRNSNDDQKMLEYSKKAAGLEQQVKLLMPFLENAEGDKNILETFEIFIKAFYIARKYKVIIDAIPENRLDDLMDDPDKKAKVIEIIVEKNDELYECAEKTGILKRDLIERLKKTGYIHDVANDINQPADDPNTLKYYNMMKEGSNVIAADETASTTNSNQNRA